MIASVWRFARAAMGESNRQRPAPVSYALRPATAGDFALIHALRASGLRAYVAPIWRWDDREQQHRFARRFDPLAYQVIVVDGQDVGCVAVEWGIDTVFLTDIEIAAAWRGRGLGSAVLGDIVAEAQRRGLPVRLQVLRENPVRRLYERLGFHLVGETATHIIMHASPHRGGASGVDDRKAG